MSYQDVLEANLIQAEGEVLWMYRDSLGYATLGVGHLIDQRKGGKISQAASRFMLQEDMVAADSEVHELIPTFDALSDNRKAALAEMVFNLGEGGLAKFDTFLGFIASGDFAGAADDLKGTKWATEVSGRAVRIANMIRSG